MRFNLVIEHQAFCPHCSFSHDIEAVILFADTDDMPAGADIEEAVEAVKVKTGWEGKCCPLHAADQRERDHKGNQFQEERELEGAS